jgi:hypothetical protein
MSEKINTKKTGGTPRASGGYVDGPRAFDVPGYGFPKPRRAGRPRGGVLVNARSECGGPHGFGASPKLRGQPHCRVLARCEREPDRRSLDGAAILPPCPGPSRPRLPRFNHAKRAATVASTAWSPHRSNDAPPREGLEAGDLKQPSGNGGAALKSASVLPDIKEHIAQKIPLGHGLGADEPEQPTKESSYPSRSAEDA